MEMKLLSVRCRGCRLSAESLNPSQQRQNKKMANFFCFTVLFLFKIPVPVPETNLELFQVHHELFFPTVG